MNNGSMPFVTYGDQEINLRVLNAEKFTGYNWWAGKGRY